jgi:hypothetical protein
MGHPQPRRPRPEDDTSQEEAFVDVTSILSVMVGLGMLVAALATASTPAMWVGVAFLLIGVVGLNRPIGPEPEGLPTLSSCVWIDAAKADYASGKIEIEQLEVDLEQALAGKMPERMRPAARAPNGAPRTPQTVRVPRRGAVIDAPTPTHAIPNPWDPANAQKASRDFCEEHGHQYELGDGTCVICGKTGPTIEHR